MSIQLEYSPDFDLSSLRLEDPDEEHEDVFCFNIKKKKFKYKKIKFLNLPKNVLKCISSYLEKKYIFVPLFFATKKLGKFPDSSKIRQRNIELSPSVSLRDYQKEAFEDIMKSINKNRSAVLSFHTGAGKTLTAIYTACQLKLKTLILFHLKNLKEQWEEELRNLTVNSKIQILTSNSILEDDVDFYLCNISTVGKLINKNSRIFHKIQFLIIDEIHCYYTEKRINSLLHITPICSLALSATPDESKFFLSQSLNLFFGNNRIIRKLNIKNIVYHLFTKLQPVIEYDVRGKIVWSSILQYQAVHPDRNKIISNIIEEMKDRNIIILCKRIEQAKLLFEECKREGKEILTGKTKHFNKECKVLFTTYSKSGVGFNLKHLNTLIIASDVGSYISQYFGRITRDMEIDPIVIDLVDDQSSLKSHWYKRRQYYISVGGEVTDYLKTEHGKKLMKEFSFLNKKGGKESVNNQIEYAQLKPLKKVK